VVLILASSLAYAAGPQGVHEPGTGLTSPEIKEAAQGSGQGLVQAGNYSNASTGAQGIHEPGTGLVNPELKEAAQGTGQGMAQSAQPTNESVPSNQKAQPGFEAVFALMGLFAVAYIARYGQH
jgi:hypothetical protein